MMKKIAILMCTFNGEKYLREQIDSLIKQKGEFRLHIYISDDGSSDKTLSICNQKKYKKYIKKIFKVNYNSFSKNFLSLIQKTPNTYDYYSFCDQDDIWKTNKLYIAVRKLEKFNLYCSRTTLINDDKKLLGYSPLFKNEPCFKNAIVQSIAGGNTMVTDNELFKKFKKEKILDAPSYDWLLYIFASITGKKIFYDKNSYIFYRQHSNNLVGSNNGFFSQLQRILLTFQGRFKFWSDCHLEILNNLSNKIDVKNKNLLDHFVKLRTNYFFLIECLIKKDLKIFRQTSYGNLSLKIALLLKLI